MSTDIKTIVSDYIIEDTTLDVTSTGNTTIYTDPAGYRFIIDHVDIICGSAASTTATVTIGQSTALTDFLDTQTLTNLAAQYDVVHLYPVPNATPVKTKSYAAGKIIQIAVTTADADGSSDASVLLFGYLRAA